MQSYLLQENYFSANKTEDLNISRLYLFLFIICIPRIPLRKIRRVALDLSLRVSWYYNNNNNIMIHF